MIEWINVRSSAIQKVGYDSAASRMYANGRGQFSNGRGQFSHCNILANGRGQFSHCNILVSSGSGLSLP